MYNLGFIGFFIVPAAGFLAIIIWRVICQIKDYLEENK